MCGLALNPKGRCNGCERRLRIFTESAPHRSRGFTSATYAATDEHARIAVEQTREWLNMYDRRTFDRMLADGEVPEEDWPYFRAASIGGPYPECNLYIWGGQGRGKSTLAFILMREFVKAYSPDEPCYWVNVKRALRDRDFNDDIFRDEATHLVLDDIGQPLEQRDKRRLSGWISDRYDLGSGTTIITTNYDPEALARRLAVDDEQSGVVDVSRLLDNTRRLELGGVDRRVASSLQHDAR